MVYFLGLAVYHNAGLLVAVAVILPQWARGEYLDPGVSMSILGMVFFIFASINGMTYFAMTITQQLLAAVQRLSEVLEMAEVHAGRKTDLPPDQAHVTLTDADLSWGYKGAQQAKPEEGKGKEDNKENNTGGAGAESKKAAAPKPEEKKKGPRDAFRVQLEAVSEPVLRSINLSLKPGDFVTVVGKVGCGKTSLLYSIMEETQLLKGDRVVQGTLAYVEQEPFIYSATV